MDPTRRIKQASRYLLPLASVAALLWSGCQHSDFKIVGDETKTPTSAYSASMKNGDRRGNQEPFQPAPELTTLTSRPAAVELMGPVQGSRREPATQPSMDTTIWLQIPDPLLAEEVFKKRLDVTRFSPSIRTEYEKIYFGEKKPGSKSPSGAKPLRGVVAYVKEIERPKQYRLTLSEALRRALASNYQIRVDGYAPAISTAQVVQAEAAFDAAFFANASRNNTDQPQPLIQKTPRGQRFFETDTTLVNGGIRKLLSTGATLTFTQAMSRTDNPSTVYTQYQPLWATNFIAELRQPFLRNFGVDYNRAQINIRKNERKISEEQFRARVIDTLVNTEKDYWTLVGARRDVVLTAELLSEAELTLEQIVARKDFDAYGALLSRSEAAVKAREVEFIDVKKNVRNAEDQLLNFINDPQIPLSRNYEIIPVDNPTSVEVIRDQYHEVETALIKRPEIAQAQSAVDNARLQLGIAKNQALPKLDVVYRMTVNGVGPSADRGFDQETGSNFIDQFVGVEFAWNFGERGERATMRIAALQQSQAVLRYKKVLDDTITDCRVSLRNLESNYRQLEPSYEGVLAAAENLRSLQERQERKSPPELDATLSSQINLATARRSLLQALVNYNSGIVNVERSKGTLAEYDNVVVSEQP